MNETVCNYPVKIKLQKKLAKIAQKIGYKTPVYITPGVWSLVKEGHKNSDFHTIDEIIRDILFMGAHTGVFLNRSTKRFRVIIAGTKPKNLHELYLQINPAGNNDPPAATIMRKEDL